MGFYDKTVSLVVELVYSTTFDPAKPIFGKQTQPQPQPQAQVQSQPSSQSSNIAGQWSIISLFDVALPKSAYSLIITVSSIQLIGGCNSYSYDYTINSNTQVINIGNSVSTKNECDNSDDQLYVSGINKIYKYILSNVNGAPRLNFYDQAGNIGYAL